MVSGLCEGAGSQCHATLQHVRQPLGVRRLDAAFQRPSTRLKRSELRREVQRGLGDERHRNWGPYPTRSLVPAPIHSSIHPPSIILTNRSNKWLASWGPGEASG